jgi:DNA-binding response OmpR family regulator
VRRGPGATLDSQAEIQLKRPKILRLLVNVRRFHLAPTPRPFYYLTEMRLLLVEDDAEMRNAIARRFRARGDVVDPASSLGDAQRYLDAGDYDVIVLDRMLSDGDGVDALAAWRRAGCETPVLVLTAKCEVARRVEGFEAGADDYLGKPFAVAELVHRVAALARRRTREMPLHIRIGDLHVDTARREVRRHQVVVPLRAKEYVVLEFLLSHRGRVVTRAQLRDACWDETATSNVEETTLASLRRKLGDPPLIHTRRGHGYILEAAVEEGE